MTLQPPQTALAVPTIPVADIVTSLSNPRKRIDETYLAELAESIKAHGVIQPITVRPASVDRICAWNGAEGRDNEDPGAIPRYEIVVGECRWRAAQLAGLTDIPGYWRDLDDKQVLEIQVIENLQRRDVHPIEEADGYHRLIEKHGYTAEQIGEKIGKSRSYVYARMKLSALGDIAREAFFDGEFDASVALLIARIADEKEQKKAVNALRNQSSPGEPISFRSAKYLFRNGFTKDLTIATFKADDAELLPSAGSCTDCPKRSGNHPELHPDIESADVCTDPRCFEEKRLARHQQLLDAYEKRQIRVVTGDEVKEIAPHGTDWSISRAEWVLDNQHVKGDPENRTYREILGDYFPVTTVVEVKGNIGNKLVELASPTAIAEAMEKAGITIGDAAAEAELAAEQERLAEKNRQRQEVIEKAVQAREDLLHAIMEKLREGTYDAFPIVVALAVAWLKQEISYNGIPTRALEACGVEFPDSFDYNEMSVKLCEEVQSWPIGKALSLLTFTFTKEEHQNVFDHGTQTLAPAIGLEGVSRALDIDPDTFVGAFPSSQAAQAAEPERAECPLAVGDRVRIREDIEGTDAWKKKVCGREGVIEATREAEGVVGDWVVDVRTKPGKTGLIADLVVAEVEKIEPATIAAQAGDQGTDPIETNETPTGAEPAEAQTGAENADGQKAIETNEKPTEAAKGAALYTHPDNPDLTWSGRGRKPTWVQSWLADGNTLDELRAS